MTPPLSPERLTRLLDDAVRPVTARPGALDRIREGSTRRRRRTAPRAAVVLLAAAVIAGGTAAAVVVTSGGGPARIASPPASAHVFSSAAQAAQPAGQTRTAALPTVDQQAVPTAASSALRSFAGSAPSSASQPVVAPPGASASASQPVLATPGPSAPASAPSSASSSAPSSSPSSSPPPSASRAAAGIPTVASPVTWAVDGPGQPVARVTLVPVGNARTTFSFRLVVHTARYSTQTVPFSATSVTGMPPLGPVVVGAANAAKDGHTELFVMVDAGCCTEFWTIFRLVDGRVLQVKLAGAPVRLAVGGSVTDNGGFSCAGPNLVTYTYAHQAASGTRETFLATRDTYRWAGASLLLVSQRKTTIRGAQNPELAQYSGVSCGALPQYVLKR
ncbi:MAG: hypothetical protein ACRDOU_03690 [Streptosporangiaceae bacterium]